MMALKFETRVSYIITRTYNARTTTHAAFTISSSPTENDFIEFTKKLTDARAICTNESIVANTEGWTVDLQD